ncbi:hypothetical protein GGI21_003139, partial [Coemansia aciculifera]
MEAPPFSEELSKYPRPPAEDSSSGETTPVQTNYSRVELTGKHIYVYQVSVTNLDARTNDKVASTTSDRQVTDPQARSEIFIKAQAKFSSKKYVYFDGKEYAYSPRSLHKHWTSGEESREVTHVGGDSGLPCQFQVTLRALRKYESKELLRYCDGSDEVPDSYVQGFLFALDEIIRSCSKRQFLSTGGGRWLSSYRPVVTLWGFDVWWEYRLTMRAGRGALFVNIGAKAVPVISVGDLAELSRLFFEKKVAALQQQQQRRSNDGQPKGSVIDLKTWVASFEPAIRGLQVHIPGTTTIATIAKLSAQPASQLTTPGGGESLAAYYQRKFNLSIGDPTIPCAIMTSPGMLPVAVPLSLCRLPGEDRRQVQGVVAPWQHGDFVHASAVAPSHRHDVLAHGMRMVAKCGDGPDLRAFGIRISATLASVSARVLDPPRIVMQRGSGGKSEDVVGSGGSGSGCWEIGSGQRVVDSAQLRSWAVVVFGQPGGQQPALVRAFITQYVKVCVGLGIDVQQTEPPIKYATAWNDIARVIEEARQLAEKSSGERERRAQLVFCILPFNSVALYGEIKRVALTLVGVQTQCVQMSNVRAHNPRLLTSVALKMNVKLGGFTANVKENEGGGALGEEIPTMVISADVNHTTEAGGMSVAAVLSSTDLRGHRYAGTVLQHPQRMEYIENFDAIIRQSLRIFYRSTGGGVKPMRIIYYRDGVSDSQMQMVKQLELAAIYRGCRLIDPEYRPQVTVVLVRKRHHSRFFPLGDAAGAGNCLVGTSVAAEVVSPLVFSFYLLAHRSPFGVSKPAYYLV